jgi:hypothetical protein
MHSSAIGWVATAAAVSAVAREMLSAATRIPDGLQARVFGEKRKMATDGNRERGSAET